jgi:hypothetical protein
MQDLREEIKNGIVKTMVKFNDKIQNYRLLLLMPYNLLLSAMGFD